MEYKSLQENLDQLPSDLRFEVLLGELVENQVVEIDKVRVNPLGIFHRGYKRDLEKLEIHLDELDKEKVKHFSFSLWREGIFDVLPQGIFFQPTNRKYKKESDEIKKELDQQHREEKAGRDFFQPLDQEFYRQKLALELKEREVFADFSSEAGREIFARKFWNIDPSGIPQYQITTLLHLLPHVFRYKGKLDKCSQLLSILLRHRVLLKKTWGKFSKVDAKDHPGLGDTFLGVNMVAGQIFSDGRPQLRIILDQLPLREIPRFIGNGPQAKIITIFSRFFLPVDAEIEVILNVKRQERSFSLERNDYHGRLGYSTFL